MAVARHKLKRAQILLAANDGMSDEAIAATLKVSGSTIYRTKRRLVEANLEGALSEEPRPRAARKLSGKEEALLVATACSTPPPGRARWTLELLADEMVRLTEFHHTPKHASWLNMVEIEIGVLRSQCLDRGIDDKGTIIAEVAAWERQRNAEGAQIKWMFTTEKAREKLRKAYPVKES